MTVKPLVQRSTLPVGMATLGVLVIGTGWLLIEGLPFVLGCAIINGCWRRWILCTCSVVG